MKVLLNSFDLNSYTLGFHTSTLYYIKNSTISFKWLHFEDLCRDSKACTTWYSIISSTKEKYYSKPFVNKHTLEFYPQTNIRYC